MSRHIKRLLMLFGFVVLVACMWIGWYLLRIHAATQHIAWQAQEGGLTLSYFPLKDQAIIFVGSDYAQGGTLTWTMTDPGATNWIIAPPPYPRRRNSSDERGSENCTHPCKQSRNLTRSTV